MVKHMITIFAGTETALLYRARLLLLLGFVAVLVYFGYTGLDGKLLGTKQFTQSTQQRKEEFQDKKNLTYAARVLMTQIEEIQSSNCSQGYSIKCGHHDEGCGLGCQLHHRAACLIMSYAMRLPLIHDAETDWPYDSPWESMYQNLGSNCSMNNRTIEVKWDYAHMKPRMTLLENNTEIKYVLRDGIPIDAELHRIIEQNHPEPFLWFLGQFLKYTTRLSDELRPSFERWFQSLEFPRVGPFIGFQVRRTDKITEAKDSFHKIEEYVKPTEEYLRKTKQNVVIPHTVYIASDDHTVLEETQRKYSTTEWRFIGQQMNVTFKNSEERRSPVALVSAVQDLAALSKCEYLVCGLSSNFCRLVFEILYADYPDASEHLKPLDQSVLDYLFGHMMPDKLIPVNGSQRVQIMAAKKWRKHWQ